MALELRTQDGHISQRRRLGPQLIGCFGLDAELLAYLRAQLKSRWPGCRLHLTHDATALRNWQVDLWFSTVEPVPLPQQPLLLLCGPTRTEVMEWIRPGLWQLAAPYCRGPLLDAVWRLWFEAHAARVSETR